VEKQAVSKKRQVNRLIKKGKYLSAVQLQQEHADENQIPALSKHNYAQKNQTSVPLEQEHMQRCLNKERTACQLNQEHVRQILDEEKATG